MPAPRPKRIRIGTFHFKVKWAPGGITADQGDEIVGLDGYSHIGEQEIVVRTNMHPDQEKATLLHEVLHMCLAVSGCLPDSGRIAEGAMEETVVRALEPSLFGTLRDNPQLVAYLLER